MSATIPPIPSATAPAALIPTLNDRIRKINLALAATSPDATAAPAAAAGGAVTAGTHAARLSAGVSAGAGALWIETDRNDVVYQLEAGAWHYVAGIYPRTQAQLVAFAATLGPNDAGYLVNVTDYAHILQWGGAAWQWAPGEQGSGMLVAFALAPTGNGWQACNGTTGVTYLKSDGTTGTLTVPNTASSAAYMKLGAGYAAAITAPTVPTISTPTLSGATDGHALSVAEMPAHTHDLGSSGGITATAGTWHADNLDYGNTQATTSAGSGNTHSHTLGAAAVSTPTATLPADPVANFEALLYFRK